jgi:hypothetical protein
MQQIKIFKGVETEVQTLEAEVNAWIQQSGARIISITGNIAPQSERIGGAEGGADEIRFFPSDVLLVVLYETD